MKKLFAVVFLSAAFAQSSFAQEVDLPALDSANMTGAVASAIAGGADAPALYNQLLAMGMSAEDAIGLMIIAGVDPTTVGEATAAGGAPESSPTPAPAQGLIGNPGLVRNPLGGSQGRGGPVIASPT